MPNQPFTRWGSGKMFTGFSRQSDELPSACLVDEPSNIQMGHSSRVPPKSDRTMVLLRMFCVGSYPSSQMYSSFAFSVMGINRLAMRAVYETYA